MKNVMEIDGYEALMAFDPDTNQHLSQFVDLNVGVEQLKSAQIRLSQIQPNLIAP